MTYVPEVINDMKGSGGMKWIMTDKSFNMPPGFPHLPVGQDMGKINTIYFHHLSIQAAPEIQAWGQGLADRPG